MVSDREITEHNWHQFIEDQPVTAPVAAATKPAQVWLPDMEYTLSIPQYRPQRIRIGRERRPPKGLHLF
jgi:hypothetical protein